MVGGNLASWEVQRDVKEGDAPLGSQVRPRWCDRIHSRHPETAPFCPPLLPPFTPLHGLGGDVPPSPQDQVPPKMSSCPPGLQRRGCARRLFGKARGSGRARWCQTARGPNWLISTTSPLKKYETCCHSLIHQPDRSSKSRLPTRFHFSPNLISVLNYKLIMGSH